ncbi:penicillin-binding transpeptidase domain-containing protein [candidate division CSSED10-310 bacterium]|uniref:Penicillin-binding transpeptidase domain-containing protein n=1 Tax=candidate division CSSED10-310 bacterium TaxID=2855610 RepID=A0ABV6YTY4_UNCC1
MSLRRDQPTNYLKIVEIFLAPCLILLMMYLFTSCRSGELCSRLIHFTQQMLKPPPNEALDTTRSPTQVLEKKELQPLFEKQNLVNLQSKYLDLVVKDHPIRVETSLDIPLQSFVLQKLNRSFARYVGIVVMDPQTGRILTMVGHDRLDAANNPCLDNSFPAASIFKIVTAAAAIEQLNLDQDSRLSFNGRKHTLYRYQLKDRKNRWTTQISLRDSFAQSVNPVFGKIGSLYLKKSGLEKYAQAFGFNCEIDFEISLPPSNVTVGDKDYNWAEIASGFNRETRITPLHGGLLVSTILHQGRLIAPTIIDQITDEQGEILYRNRLATIKQVISEKTSTILADLMTETVDSGTSRKTFRGYQKDPVLSKLRIGGKTGSISNHAHDARFDWFVGYAEEKNGSEQIVVSIVVAHEKYIGTRAATYARMIMKHYFQHHFASNQTASDPSQG